MSKEPESGTVLLSNENKQKLRAIGVMGESYNDVVNLLIDIAHDFKALLDAINTGEADTKSVASNLSSKYVMRIAKLKEGK
jgi:hypothetical protein